MRALRPTELVPLAREAQRQAEAQQDQAGPTAIDRQLESIRTGADVHAALKRQLERVEGGAPLSRRLIGGTPFKMDTSGRGGVK